MAKDIYAAYMTFNLPIVTKSSNGIYNLSFIQSFLFNATLLVLG